MQDYLNKITQGDCVELMRQLPDKSVDMIFTDPPYFVFNKKWDSRKENPLDMQQVYAEWQRILKPNGLLFMFGTLEMWHDCRQWFRYRFNYIWEKNTSPPVMDAYIPLKIHEYIFCFCQKELKKIKTTTFNRNALKVYGVFDVHGGTKKLNKENKIDSLIRNTNHLHGNTEKHVRHGTTVLKYKRPWSLESTTRNGGNFNESVLQQTKYWDRTNADVFHPTQKPVDLIQYVLGGYSNEGDIILDPFSGSGSTACACVDINRQFIAFEKDADYYEKSCARLERYVERKANGYRPKSNKPEQQISLFD